MWVISAMDSATGVDLVGLDKMVFSQTDENGNAVVGQDGNPVINHYELVGIGFGGFRLPVMASSSEDDINAASSAIFYEMQRGTEMFDLRKYVIDQQKKAASANG